MMNVLVVLTCASLFVVFGLAAYGLAKLLRSFGIDRR